MQVTRLDDKYDVVVIGSGFGSLFMVETYLKRHPKARIAIIERGTYRDHAWQVDAGRNSDIDVSDLHGTGAGEKPWNYTVGFGGGLNCWWAQTPRFHPTDFQTHTLYGKGIDWPMSYDDLEESYCLAEERMNIAGDPAMAAILPRSRDFSQPAHRLTTIDRMMMAKQADMHVPMSTARASQPTDDRGQCCSSAKCNLCPVDAKFSIHNGFASLLEAEGIDIILDAEVRYIDHAAGVAKGVQYLHHGQLRSVSGDLVVLGANGVHSPAILLRSGIDGEWVGRGIHEQHSIQYEAYLDGLDNFDGGTVTTSLNFALYDGGFRKNHGGALLYFENRWSFGLRPEPGKWRMTLPIWVSIEDLPSIENHVMLDASENPVVSHKEMSAYALGGAKMVDDRLEKLLAPLPVEKLHYRGIADTASHIQGSVRMGKSRKDSVVDGGLLHHDIRNLMIVGSGVIPTSSCANPSLTTAALSIFATNRL
ncbi:GMC family oxidoreductase [Agrobacterium rubi]|nr:GMC family oxidoreductase [Agrobacterium rubi]NTF24681.1 GMC family oxidoreductase [Agrobacterium rubi]